MAGRQPTARCSPSTPMERGLPQNTVTDPISGIQRFFRLSHGFWGRNATEAVKKLTECKNSKIAQLEMNSLRLTFFSIFNFFTASQCRRGRSASVLAAPYTDLKAGKQVSKNPKGILQQKPRVASSELPWGTSGVHPLNLEEVAPTRRMLNPIRRSHPTRCCAFGAMSAVHPES